jgi:hypothetical protein
MKFNVKLRKNYDRKQPLYDYLKYYRVVRYWVKTKYGVNITDMEFFMFLYSEKLFSHPQFREYECVFPWDNDRFNRYLRDGWIIKWRENIKNKGALYELSHKGKHLITSIYKKLNGEDVISESNRQNPLFNANRSYTDNMYKRAIKNMNLNYKEKQRLKRIDDAIYASQPHAKKYREARGLPPHPSLE